jgi:hypothetical protein
MTNFPQFLQSPTLLRIFFFFLEVDRNEVRCFFAVGGRDGEGAGVILKMMGTYIPINR